MFFVGFLAGGIWALIPGYLKVKFNVNEIISTIMLNYVALLMIDYLVLGPWMDPKHPGFPMTPRFSDSAVIPSIPGTRIHLTVILAILSCFILNEILWRTTMGFEIRVSGESRDAARYAGISYSKVALFVMLVSGGLAGIAGVGEVSGIQHRLLPELSPGYGYTAIIVAWLAKLNPLMVIPTSFLLGGLFVGVDAIQVVLGLPMAVVYMFQGIILFLILGGEILTNYRVKLTWK